VAGPVLALSARSPVADVAHAFSEPLLMLAPRARLRVLHYQNEVVASTPLQHWLLGRADLVVCCSDFIRQQALTRTRLAPDRVVTVWNGVDLDAFQGDVSPEARARYGLRTDELMILFAGAVVPEKGLAHLLRALALLRDVPPWRLVVAGGASLWPTLDDPHPADDSAYAREVRALGADLPVSWLGNVPQATMPGLFVLADMFVCPSVWDDPFPTVNVEAMAGGTPIVASRVGGIPEAIEDGVTGALVPPGDPAPLADALRGLLTDPDRRRRQGIAARARAEHFSWDAAALRLDEAYRRLLLARCRR